MAAVFLHAFCGRCRGPVTLESDPARMPLFRQLWRCPACGAKNDSRIDGALLGVLRGHIVDREVGRKPA